MCPTQTTPAGETSPASVSRGTSSMSCPLRRGGPYGRGAQRSRFRRVAAKNNKAEGKAPPRLPPASWDEAEDPCSCSSASGEIDQMPPPSPRQGGRRQLGKGGIAATAERNGGESSGERWSGPEATSPGSPSAAPCEIVSIGMAPMSEPNGSSKTAGADDGDMANSRAISRRIQSLRQSARAMAKR